MMLAPSVAKRRVTASRVLVPSATTTTTAVTPMRMPRMVSDARSFDRAMARNAIRIAARNPHTSPALPYASTGGRSASDARASWRSTFSTSLRTRPSRMVMTRLAQAAMSGSWVTRQMVMWLLSLRS